MTRPPLLSAAVLALALSACATATIDDDAASTEGGTGGGVTDINDGMAGGTGVPSTGGTTAAGGTPGVTTGGTTSTGGTTATGGMTSTGGTTSTGGMTSTGGTTGGMDCTGATEWTTGTVAYTAGDLISYQGGVYTADQDVVWAEMNCFPGFDDPVSACGTQKYTLVPGC